MTGRLRRAVPVGAVVLAAALAPVLAACGDDGEDAAPDVVLSAAGERGKVVASENGCVACHTADGGGGTGPTWRGFYGSEVELDDIGTVEADEEYLRRAILDPRSEVRAGYANVMPVYEGQLSDDELDDVIAYLRDLSTLTAGSGDGEEPGG